MTDRPIIFSAPMVRALLDGRKTQTRRLLKGGVPEAPSMDSIGSNQVARHPAPYLDSYCSERPSADNPRGMSNLWCWWTRDDRMGRDFRVPFKPGDRLYVREGWEVVSDGAGYSIQVRYLADGEEHWFDFENQLLVDGRKRPSIHMPRAASRLTLLVTGVKVERLQDISEADAQAEGADGMPTWGCYRDGFNAIWLDIHGIESWKANPWIVAVSLEVIRANIDALPAARAA